MPKLKSINEISFNDAQTALIAKLQKDLDAKQLEIEHLKQLLLATVPAPERIILSPEEALIEEQLTIIQQRSYGKELTLEDIKKLDLLIKNQKLVKSKDLTLEGEFKKLKLSSAELIKIVQNDSPNDK